jgi:hypothetical protein
VKLSTIVTLQRVAGMALLLAVLVLSANAAGAQKSSIGSADQIQGPGTSAFINLVASRNHLSTDRLEASPPVSVGLDVTGISFYEAKVLDKQTGQEYPASIDGKGQAVDADAARKAEEAAHWQRYGKLEPSLADKMVTSGHNFLPVAIWVHPPDLSDLQRKDPDLNASIYKQNRATTDAAFQNYLSAMHSRIVSATTPVLTALTQAGYQAQAADGAPLIATELPASAIRLLAQRSDVDTIFDAEVQGSEEELAGVGQPARSDATLQKLMLGRGQGANADTPDYYAGPRDFGQTAERMPQIEQAYNFTGSGVKVAVVSPYAINPSNPFLLNATHGIDYYSADRTFGSATAAAGVIASTDASVRGRAPNISRLLSANYVTTSEANIENATNWAINNGADVIDFATLRVPTDPSGFDWFAVYADYVASVYYKTVTAGSGYTSNGSPDGARSPAVGWDVLAAGNFYDASFSYDGYGYGEGHFNPTLSYGNESNYFTTMGDHSKPDVIADAPLYSTTNSAPWLGSGGLSNSFDAAAGTAGHAAALMQANYSYLRSWPEVMRAIIMAGANNELAESNSVEEFVRGLDGMEEGYTAYTGSHGSPAYWGLYLGPGSFDANGNYDLPSFYLSAGSKARVAMAWDSDPTTEAGDTTYHGLTADLDMQVLNPSGGLVTSSDSAMQAREIAEFTATTSGYYHVRIHKYRWTGGRGFTYAGVAVNALAGLNPQTNPYQSPCWGSQTFVPAGGGTYASDSTVGGNYWDNYVLSSGTPIPWAETGPERLYYKYTAVQGFLTATLTYVQPAQNLDVFIVGADNGLYPACRRNDSTYIYEHRKDGVVAYGGTQAVYHVTIPGWYAFIVDGYNGSAGQYTLRIDWKPIQPPPGTPTPTSLPTDTPGPLVTVPPHDTPATEPPTPTNAPGGTVLPTRTEAPTVTPAPSPSETIVDPTNVPPPSQTPAPPQLTETPCAISFTDVQPDNPFYVYIHWLACNAIISGYADGTFRPGNNTTRAQFTKMITLGIGWPQVAPATPSFEDVLSDNVFYPFVETAYSHHIISGYQCGGPGEPCDPQNRPYFRPNNYITRGQLSKLLILARQWPIYAPETPTFEDVPADFVFYGYIETVAHKGIASGYQCGGPGEPCDPQNRPYFRPFNNGTRGQLSKMLYITLDLPQSP